ncbi:unnamed protein product [Heligmosomoides polygyrus]|uniref:Ovule protein n=1 Tax=Heligmosomoides polygyrus TaxID=6339 RepID=A0A183GBT5_HELPZ|nr:unnamed protein product [Heligmosomoides polygyrus]
MPLTLMELDSVKSVVRYSVFFTFNLSPNIAKRSHLPLEIIFVFASEHHVISIKQRPWNRLLKISRNGIHDGNKEKWGKRRTLVHPNRDGKLH